MQKILTIQILFMCVFICVFGPVSLANAANVSRATALRKVGIENFAAKKNGPVTQAQADQLTQRVIADVSAMSYLEAVPVSAPESAKGSRRELLSAAVAANLDGVIVGAVGASQIQGLILSREGEVLGRFTLNMPVHLENEAQVRAISKAIVDEIARAVPYRGFITRVTPDNYYELNLGSDQGLIKGQRFRIFDFTTASFNSPRVDLGEAEVVDVTPTTAIIEPVGNKEFRVFGKIGFNENAHGMADAQQIETRGSVFLGGGFLNVNASGDSGVSDRGYHIGSATILLAGGTWDKISGFGQLAAFSTNDTDLIFTEVLVDREIYERPLGANKFSVRVGGRVGQMSVTAKKGVTTNLQSTTSVSPDFVARIDRSIRGPLRGFLSVTAYVPIYVSGMSMSALLWSAGVEGRGGLTFDLSSRFFLDVGARYSIIRRPVVDTSVVSETYTEAFGDIGYRF